MLLRHGFPARDATMLLDSSRHPRQESPIGFEAKERGVVSTNGAPGRALRQGIPDVLDWIDEAEAVHRPMASKVLIGMIVATIAIVVASRLGWLAS